MKIIKSLAMKKSISATLKLLKLSIVLILLSLSHAESNNFAVGIGFGNAPGSGISAKYNFRGNYALGVNILPAYLNEVPEVTDLILSLGLDPAYTFYKGFDDKVFVSLPLSFWFFEKTTQVQELINDKLIESELIQNGRAFNIGLMIGYEKEFIKIGHISLSAGLMGQLANGRRFGTIFMGSPTGSFNLLPAFSANLRFYLD